MIRTNKRTIKRATIQKKEEQLIARAAAAGGKMEILRNRDGSKIYAVYPADQIEQNDPVPCKTLREAESFIEIDEFLQDPK